MIALTCGVFYHSYGTFHGLFQGVFIFQTCLLDEITHGFQLQVEHWLLWTWIALSVWSCWALTLYLTQVPWPFPDLWLWPTFPLPLHYFCAVYTVSFAAGILSYVACVSWDQNLGGSM